MKKAMFLFLALALMFALAGCGHTHEWQDATCTEPKTCAADGATEGEPLGHDWRDADCTEPKTCARCGETEGGPLGHDWQEATCAAPKTCARCGATEGEALPHTPLEADYWTPSVCAVCGEELGPVLTPFFVEKGWHTDMKVGVPVDVEFPVSEDKPTIKTVVHMTIDRAESHDALVDYVCGDGQTVWNFEAEEGYEWQTVHGTFVFWDENFNNNRGGRYAYFYIDYYAEATETVGDDDWQVLDYGDQTTGHMTYRGEEYEYICVMHTANGPLERNDDGSFRNACYFDLAFRVPVGYDGMVVGPDIFWPLPEGESFMDYITPETPMFRYIPETAEG